jgi:hypothetical protein
MQALQWRRRRGITGGRFAGFGLALISTAWLTACRPSSAPLPSIVLAAEISPQPLQVGVSTVMLKLNDAAGNPINDARIRLEGTMTHPGMRPVFSAAEPAGVGRYRSSLEFTMAGDWVVLVHITLPNGQQLERQIDVKGVRAG